MVRMSRSEAVCQASRTSEDDSVYLESEPVPQNFLEIVKTHRLQNPKRNQTLGMSYQYSKS